MKLYLKLIFILPLLGLVLMIMRDMHADSSNVTPPPVVPFPFPTYRPFLLDQGVSGNIDGGYSFSTSRRCPQGATPYGVTMVNQTEQNSTCTVKGIVNKQNSIDPNTYAITGNAKMVNAACSSSWVQLVWQIWCN